MQIEAAPSSRDLPSDAAPAAGRAGAREVDPAAPRPVLPAAREPFAEDHVVCCAGGSETGAASGESDDERAQREEPAIRDTAAQCACHARADSSVSTA